LHEAPSDDFVVWRRQVKKAQWIEERVITGLGRHIGANIRIKL
jgi:hypothetical protein